MGHTLHTFFLYYDSRGGGGGVLPWFAAMRMCSVFLCRVCFCLTLTLGWQSADQPM